MISTVAVRSRNNQDEQEKIIIPYIEYYELSYRYNPKSISALSSIGYCYEHLKEYDKALEFYQQYMKFGKPGTSGYQFVKESIDYIKQENSWKNRALVLLSVPSLTLFQQAKNSQNP